MPLSGIVPGPPYGLNEAREHEGNHSPHRVALFSCTRPSSVQCVCLDCVLLLLDDCVKPPTTLHIK